MFYMRHLMLSKARAASNVRSFALSDRVICLSPRPTNWVYRNVFFCLGIRARCVLCKSEATATRRSCRSLLESVFLN